MLPRRTQRLPDYNGLIVAVPRHTVDGVICQLVHVRWHGSASGTLKIFLRQATSKEEPCWETHDRGGPTHRHELSRKDRNHLVGVGSAEDRPDVGEDIVVEEAHADIV
jgi:hypothetical protein